jgi:ABC-type multidrug transport system ATPase subunit
MQVLCGRAPGLRCTGDVTLNGRAIDPHSQRNGFGYTPQEDLLIGDITVRYMLSIALYYELYAVK